MCDTQKFWDDKKEKGDDERKPEDMRSGSVCYLHKIQSNVIVLTIVVIVVSIIDCSKRASKCSR